MMVRLFLAAILAATATLVHAEPVDDLNQLIDEYWANEMEESPFAATSSGVFEYNDRTPGVAPEDYDRRMVEAEQFLSRLNTIDRAALDGADRVNADLLAFILEHDIEQAKYKGWRIPFLADTGFHTNFGYTVSATPFRKEKDYEDYLKRLEGFPAYIDQHIANMRQGLADGYTQPKAILANIMPSFEAQVKERAQDHPYYAPFRTMPKSIAGNRQKALQRQGETILQQDVIPAFERLLVFMKDEYVPGARDTLGISETPDGEEIYAAAARYYTTLDDVTPEEIHQIGLREVARIRKEMNGVIKETGFDGDFAAFLDYLRTDRQFYAGSPQELLDRAAWIAKDIDGRLPAYFGKLPRQPYSVEPVPEEIAPNYTNARYVGASLDADIGGQFWVNTYNHEIRPLYQLPAMALHEGVPGHHLQSALALEIEGLPEFRTTFYPHAFGEGWGLYSEKLGVEMGVYQTPYDHFGRLTWEMWRACRLVIDTGIHLKGWTRQQAIDYLASNTALSLHNVQTEVDRYIAWPGQALAYKMGELSIWEMRAKAEKELGDDFDIREFHDAILVNGGLPIEMLRAQVDDYIAETKAK